MANWSFPLKNGLLGRCWHHLKAVGNCKICATSSSLQRAKVAKSEVLRELKVEGGGILLIQWEQQWEQQSHPSLGDFDHQSFDVQPTGDVIQMSLRRRIGRKRDCWPDFSPLFLSLDFLVDDAKTLEDDAVILRVIEAYCTSTKARQTVNSCELLFLPLLISFQLSSYLASVVSSSTFSAVRRHISMLVESCGQL